VWHAWFLTLVKWKYIVAVGDYSVEVWEIGRSWLTCGLCRISGLDCANCLIGNDGDVCFIEYDQWYKYGGSSRDVLGRIQREYDKYVELNKNVENDK